MRSFLRRYKNLPSFVKLCNSHPSTTCRDEAVQFYRHSVDRTNRMSRGAYLAVKVIDPRGNEVMRVYRIEGVDYAE